MKQEIITLNTKFSYELENKLIDFVEKKYGYPYYVYFGERSALFQIEIRLEPFSDRVEAKEKVQILKEFFKTTDYLVKGEDYDASKIDELKWSQDSHKDIEIIYMDVA